MTDAVYPAVPETVATLPAGGSIRIRPLRPADETLLIEFVARVTPDDLRLRFFAVIAGLSHEAAEALTHVDFARDMALIAQALDDDGILGVARYISDPQTREAEFAVLVRSDLKGHGIGWMLMKRLVDVARQHGIKKLSGLVLIVVGMIAVAALT